MPGPGNHARPARLGLPTIPDPGIRVKKFKIFQNHDWTTRTNTTLFKQDFHSYSKRKEWKKNVEF